MGCQGKTQHTTSPSCHATPELTLQRALVGQIYFTSDKGNISRSQSFGRRVTVLASGETGNRSSGLTMGNRSRSMALVAASQIISRRVETVICKEDGHISQ
jgi:hypothetical protein